MAGLYYFQYNMYKTYYYNNTVFQVYKQRDRQFRLIYLSRAVHYVRLAYYQFVNVAAVIVPRAVFNNCVYSVLYAAGRRTLFTDYLL